MGVIVADRIWQSCEVVTDTLAGVRTHMNAGMLKATAEIEKMASALIDKTYGKRPEPITELEKRDVVMLMDKIATEAAVAKWMAVGAAVASFYLLSFMSFFAPILKVSFVFFLFASHELHQVQMAVGDCKIGIENGIDADKVVWWRDMELERSIAPKIVEVVVVLATRLLFLNRSFFFGQELHTFVDYVERRINAAVSEKAEVHHSDVEWLPDREEGLVTVAEYLEGLKAQASHLIESLTDATSDNLNPRHVANFALEALRPIGFARAVTGIAAALLYLMSNYFLFGWITFVLSLAAGVIALELHQAHESIRTEIYEQLMRPYDTTFAEVQYLIKNANAKFRDSTWFLHKDLLLGRELKQIPVFLDQLFAAGGNFEDENVKWVDKSSLTGLVKVLKNWKIYKRDWLA